jgi:hypothetical protein
MFCPIFQVIYYKIYTYIVENLRIFGELYVFLGILGDYKAEIFWGFFD